MSQQHIGTILAIVSAAGFATLAIFMKIAFAAGLNTVTILTFRFVLAALLLWLILKIKGFSSIPAPLIAKLCLMGAIGYGTMSALFAMAVEVLPASLAAMLLYTYPALVTVLSFLIGDEHFHWRKCLALGICFGGLVLVLGVSFAGLSPTGMLLALGAALVYSCYILVGNRVLKNVDPLAATTYVCSASGLAFTVFGLLTHQLAIPGSAAGWLAIGGIVFLGTIVGILAFFGGLVHIGAANTSIISTMEPLITVCLSVLLFDDKLTALQIAGGSLILTGVVILQLWNRSTAADSRQAVS